MSVQVESLRKHQVTLAGLDRTTKNALRGEMRNVGESIAGAARTNARWSSRIPGSIKVRAQLAGKRPGVRVTASARMAPHARAYEDIERRGAFRHPVYGDREVWVPQKTRPFLAPAARAKLPAATKTLSQAVVRAVNAEM